MCDNSRVNGQKKTKAAIPKVSFIIVSYNTKRLLTDLLDFFARAPLPFGHTVIVVDNASHDGSAECTAGRKNVTIIKNPENLGYAKAVNQGIKLAKSKYICVMNTDLILNEAALQECFDFMEADADAGVCSPVVRWPNGGMQGFFFKFGLPFFYSDILNRYYSSYMKKKIKHSSKPLEVDGLMGGFLFLRSSLCPDGKLFDEDFFFYFEDTDLAYRLSKSGVRSFILPGQSIIHLGGQSSPKNKGILFYRHKYLFYEKDLGPAHRRLIYLADSIKVRQKMLKYLLLRFLFPSERVSRKYKFYREMARTVFGSASS